MRYFMRVFGAVCLLGLGTADLGAKKNPTSEEPLADPIRTYQLTISRTVVEDAIKDHLSFLQKVAPGVNEIRSQYAVAGLWMTHGRYQEAARLLKSLLEAPSKDEYFRYSAMLKLGACHMHLGHFAEAAGYFSSVSHGPVSALVPEAMIGEALALLSTGEVDLAYLRYKELSALYPHYKSHPRYMLPLGLIQWQARKYHLALQCLLLDDRNPASQYFAGLCYRQLKKFPEATGTFRRITQEHVDSPWADRARFELGETFFVQEDDLLASQTFSDIAQTHPSLMWKTLALYRLACCDLRQKKFADAERRLRELLRQKMDPSMTVNIHFLLTESLAAQGKYAELIRFLKRHPDKKRPLETQYRLVWAHAAAGDNPKAIAMSRDFLSRYDDADLTPRTLLLQGYCFERLSKWADAFASYQLVAEHYSATPYAARAVELTAMNFFRAGEYKLISTQISALWRRVNEDVQKRFPETLYWMGHASLRLKDYPQAQKMFKEFISQAPSGHPWHSEGLRAQALAYAMDKSVTDALPVMQRAYQSAQETDNKNLMAQLTLDTAHILFNAGEKSYEDAAVYYRRFSSQAPNHSQAPFALFQEALCLYRKEYYIDAADLWEKMATQYPRDPRAAESQFRAARTRFEVGRYTESVAGYQKVVRDFPKSSFVRDARFQIGQAYFNNKEWSQAIESYMDFKTRFPTDAELNQADNYIQLASFNSGMSVKEIEERFRGQAKTPLFADIYWKEGADQWNKQQYAPARENFQKILYEFPNSPWAPQASFYRAESFFLEENHKDAASSYEYFLQGYPGNANQAPAQFHLGVSYFSLNNFERAAVVFQDYLKSYPKDELAKNAALNVAISFARLGDVDKTTQAYLAYGELFPDAEDVGAAYVQLGQFLEKVGRDDRALDAYRRVTVGNPEYPQALYFSARLYKNLSEPAGERQSYVALQKIPQKSDPYRIAGLFSLAEEAIKANDAARALELYGDIHTNSLDETNRHLAQDQMEKIRARLAEAAAGKKEGAIKH